MSDVEKKKKEMIDILERIPQSGSFHRVELTKQVSELMEQYNALVAAQYQLKTLASAPEPEKTSNKGS